MSAPSIEPAVIPEAMRTSPRAGAIWGSVWLVYLIPSFTAAASADHTIVMRIVGVVLLAVFTVVYVTTLLVGWERGGGRPSTGWDGNVTPRGIRLAAVLIALSLASLLVIGEPAAGTIVFLSPIAATILPARYARWAIPGVVVAVGLAEVFARRYGTDTVMASDVLSSCFAALMAGAITLGIRRMRIVMWELHAARSDVERLATAQERVRIARDLHDVLGHSLTVISMRSQLAARLVDRGEMERAGEEIRAVEELSRSAMSDVREAVAGYRVRPFAAELAAAEATLEGAGLTVLVERSEQELPAAGEEALGFVVREGVTNVLRHSSAARCAISVRHTSKAVILELADDGRGTGAPFHEIGLTALTDGAREEPGDERCNGLRGLAERLSAVGGRLSAGDDPDGGFRLRAEVAR